MGYYIDLSVITIEELKKSLSEGYLIPSQMILRENMDERFGMIKKAGISNMDELQQVLKTKKRWKILHPGLVYPGII